MRIAWFSPVSEASGISRYSVHVVGALAVAGHDVEVFAPAAADALDTGGVPVRTITTDVRREAVAGFDAIVYNMGNNTTHHLEIYEWMVRVPGHVVMHDKFLGHFFIAYIAQVTKDWRGYLGMMRYLYGLPGQDFARGALLGVKDHCSTEALPFPLIEACLWNARGTIVHSEEAAALVTGRFGDAMPVLRLGLPVERPQQPVRVPKASLGLPEDAFTIVAHGHVIPTKRLDTAVRAVAALAEDGIPAQLVLAGGGDAFYLQSLHALVDSLGIRERVTFTGFLPEERLWEYLGVADACLNLRYPSTESASLSLLEQLALGLPTVVLNVGSYTEVPDETVLKVELENELPGVTEALRSLATDPSVHEHLAEAAQRWVAEEHDVDAYAAGLVRFLGQRQASRPQGLPKVAWDAPSLLALMKAAED